MSGAARNRESYDAIAARWDEARSRRGASEARYLDLLLEGLAAGSSVLDLGCGSGRPIAQHLLSKGLRVTGVDQSAALLALARRRLPEGEWIEADLAGFDSERRFAAVVCWDAVFHIPRALHEGIYARVAGLLEPRGRFLVTFGGSEHPPFTDTMFGQEFFYDSYAPEREMQLLDVAGFETIEAGFLNLPDGGRDKGRYAALLRRRS